MNRILFILLLLGNFLFSNHSQAQCTIDFSQTVPGLYPDTLPTGFVGQAYSEDVTFVLPLDTMGYDFLNFHILSVSLPVGLSWVCDASGNGCNYNPQVNQYGCVNISGTPLLAGQYNIDVTVIADLNIVQGVPVTFQIFMEVLPNSTPVSNNGFSMIGANGCLPVTVNFTNNNPGLLQYYWDFGNGNTSTVENPSPQIYNTIGDFPVNYSAWADTTTVHVFTLTNVTINSIDNAFSWGWPTEGNPDAYFKLKENGNVIYQSAYTEDQFPPFSWPLSVNLVSTNTYVIEVWDADVYEIIYGGDDLLGSHTMSLNGCSGCAAGSDAVVSYSINHVIINPTPSVVSADTVHVNGYPGEPNIVYDSLNHILSTDTTGYFLQWYFNDSPISGANLDTNTVTLSGEYFVVAINAAGCVAFSDTITAIYCQSLIPAINQNGNVLSTPDTTGNTFQWFDSGGPISGATNSFYGVTVADVYSVVVTDEFGCIYTSNSLNVPLSVDEILLQNSISIYPNPANDFVTVSWNSAMKVSSIKLTDITGKEIMDQVSITNSMTLDLNGISNGVYFIILASENARIQRRMVISNN